MKSTPGGLRQDLLAIIMLAIVVSIIIFINNFYIGLLMIILAGILAISYFKDFNTAKSGDKPSGLILLAYIMFAIIGVIIMIFSDFNIGIFNYEWIFTD